MTITASDLRGMITAISATIAENVSMLNALDSALGDGDHGTTISGGFAAAAEQTASAASPFDVLRLTGMTLMNRMGGSSGALFGTLFVQAAMTVKDVETLTLQQFAAMWQAGNDGVMKRGKAAPGDKTMVDALSPAVAALRQSVAQGETMEQALRAAAAAAAQGANATTEMTARHGRAQYVGERAVGHMDAGAQSVALMFSAMHDYWKGKDDGKT
ncbi:MAG: dihydroxyacetone kinase subunit L [Anaerolineaceae bacterium]|nr:dihydroxyacetone kinase subunit L [Anaerolineaceae bacterium]